MGGTGAAVSVDAEVQQMVVSIHEVVQRSFEDTEDSSGSGTLAAAVSYPAGRWLADLKERRSEPLWHRGLPPIDGAALYSTGAQMNHSCVPNVDYTWSLRTSSCSSAKATFKANRAIRAGEELTIAYCDIAQGGDVGVWRRRLLEDFGFVCNCERCEEEGGGGDNVTAADLLQPPPPLSPSAVPEPEPEPGGGGDDADPAADSDDGVSRTEEQQRLFDAAMRIHKEKFGHRGGWWHQPAAAGSASASSSDDDESSGGESSSGSTAHGWSQGQTNSGSSYWSFTDSSGKARVSFTQPTVTPTEWLKLQQQQQQQQQ